MNRIPSNSPAGANGRRSVLVYSPNRIQLTELAHVLRRNGYQAHAALTDVEAGRYLVAHKPLLALCCFDGITPDQSKAFLERLRSIDGRIPVVALGEQFDAHEARDAAYQYSDLVMRRPVANDALLELLSATLFSSSVAEE